MAPHFVEEWDWGLSGSVSPQERSQNTVPVFCSDVNELVPSVCVSPKQTKRRAKVRDRYLGQRFLFQCSLGLRKTLRNKKSGPQ